MTPQEWCDEHGVDFTAVAVGDYSEVAHGEMHQRTQWACMLKFPTRVGASGRLHQDHVLMVPFHQAHDQAAPRVEDLWPHLLPDVQDGRMGYAEWLGEYDHPDIPARDQYDTWLSLAELAHRFDRWLGAHPDPRARVDLDLVDCP